MGCWGEAEEVRHKGCLHIAVNSSHLGSQSLVCQFVLERQGSGSHIAMLVTMVTILSITPNL